MGNLLIRATFGTIAVQVLDGYSFGCTRNLRRWSNTPQSEHQEL